MITANVLARVFHIACGNSVGTAFAIDVEGRQYLVTARHVIDSIGSTGSIQVSHDENWKDIPVDPIYCANPDVDIAVLALRQQLANTNLVLEPSAGGIVMGQDVYFLGFPYGKYTVHGDILNRFPVAFIKKAILSAMTSRKVGLGVLYLDGRNNSGFSGGPIVFEDQARKPGEPKYKVAGVISGYQHVFEPILMNDEPLEDIGYLDNTGIILGYDIAYAMDAITANPIGFTL